MVPQAGLPVVVRARYALTMKIRIEIDDRLLEQARALASRDGTTLSALVEQGLRHVLSKNRQPKKPHEFRFTTFKGGGLRPEFQNASWQEILDASYERDDE
jgi:hypothetical protein